MHTSGRNTAARSWFGLRIRSSMDRIYAGPRAAANRRASVPADACLGPLARGQRMCRGARLGALDTLLRPVGDEAARPQRRMCRGESRDRDPKRRARHVVEPGLVAELNGARITAVLTADADLQVATSPAPLPGPHLHELPDTVPVEHLERVVLEDAGVQVLRQEGGRIVTRDPERRLCQVVRAEREKVGLRRDVTREQACARQLDHRADQIRYLGACFLEDL